MSPTDAERLRSLSIEALATAAQMTDPMCKSTMIEVAACYDRLADHVEQRECASSQSDEMSEMRPQRRS